MYGIYIGRFCPIHLGHQKVINQMRLETEQSVIFVGSCNSPTTLRNFFTFRERHFLIKTLYPDMSVIGLPDFPSDEDWLINLISHVQALFGQPKREMTEWADNVVPFPKGKADVVFYAGCTEDAQLLIERGFKVQEVNRYDGVKVSAQEVRDCLIHDKELRFLDPKIQEQVKNIFKSKWEDFKRV